ncbi:hypothetical protein Acsp06_20300 [Actinomycetospora sp. NBRC 106375]|uniref:hypothetical protein n=1 Tax=Actinomycetospora sp. NBRC 106375 TaxID=3032207 RepID=UPI0024A37359|nr:hypothetical protein [Actinomycetospora sp. NBRC 106375]GLZ45845.1 hypothetical protein Acsp06_20300 [Actinomycetospora sp. NBRC 106375]
MSDADLAMMDDIVGEARVDWIDMGHAIGIVSLAEGGDDDLALLRRAGGLVARLVREGRLVPGDVGTGRGAFVPWPSAPEASARFLEEYVAQVVAGTTPFEPWQPCLFAPGEGG